MVSLKDVQAGNANLKKQHESLTAVFAGATAGIGLATLRSFAKSVPKPTAIIIGRSRSKFEPEIQNLISINPDGKYTFIEAEVSLIQVVDQVSEQIKGQTSSIDLLFLSQGLLDFGGRKNTKEGIDLSIALRYYSRVRFTENLLPIMTPNARVLSVLAGTKEGKVFENDLDLENNYSMLNAMGHFTTLMTLSWDALAAKNPDKAFLHIYPGFVDTGVLGKSTSGIMGTVVSMVERVSAKVLAISPEESGQRMLFYATCDSFPKGSWSLDWDGKSTVNKTLAKYRDNNFQEKVDQHNHLIFDKAVSA